MRNIYKESKNSSGKNGARTPSASSVVRPKAPETEKYSGNVEKVIEILHQHYQEPLTLKEVSESLHLNVMYLGQLFKKKRKKFFSLFEPFAYGKSKAAAFAQ